MATRLPNEFRQLDLLKGRRQRGAAPPSAEELALHCAIADVLKRWCLPDWRYTHLPLGEDRSPATAAKLKRMGVTPGWPDFGFFHISGACCWIELKRRGGVASEAQQELAFFLMRAGHGYLLTHSFDDALNALRDWGIVPSGIHTGQTNNKPWEGRHGNAPTPP